MVLKIAKPTQYHFQNMLEITHPPKKHERRKNLTRNASNGEHKVRLFGVSYVLEATGTVHFHTP